MIDEGTLMRVKAKRKVIWDLGKPVMLAIIPRCPRCKGRHVHGWGTGARESHCDNIREPYFLVSPEERTISEKVWTRVSAVLFKIQLWCELKIMLPVLYKLSSYGLRW